ncbi:hypothetical protein [Pseudofrankia asymbiotica]|uniref:Uncharacterized protein n=1 Tax=Pseudofrankia asymbiotica TaxID=1834516 RepID=A0A1V2I1H5_9ACTN|nr:hypothetical protein [Pseudofrankia asymbiotica]ONH23466.1 hypothetical protein BL253_32805 [Pseudofrankia asymbiotica]
MNDVDDLYAGDQDGGERPRGSAYTWAVALVVAGYLAAFTFAYATAAPARGGECSGIGFGCSLHGHDAVTFVFFLLGIPIVAGVLLLTAVMLFLFQLAPSFRALTGFGQALCALTVVGILAFLLGAVLLDR